MKSAQDRVRQKSDFMSQFKLIWAVQPRYGKYSYSVFQKLVIYFARPASTRGAYRDRHGRWKRDAMDALTLPDEQGRSGRRRRVVLISRRWDQVRKMIAGDGGYESPDTEESAR